ncbi:septum formation family protein [Pseudoclavibacter helvolus]|uniref:septum formation family protein n=1 Tax=Pseudoclavibacter helvolus TaxID=255205 RepID=UPI003C71C583
MAKTTVRTALTIGALALLGLGLSGCSAAQDVADSVESELSESDVRDGETQEVTESGDLDVFKLAVGDCFNDAGSTMVSEIPVVPCADPHDYEVYHEVELPDGDFPGDEAIETQAMTDCTAQFATFVGLAYEESALDFNYLTPTQESWEGADDRLIQCNITDPAAQTSGTLAGAAR